MKRTTLKNIKRKFFAVCVPLLFFTGSSFSQIKQSFFGVQFSAKTGFVLPHRSTMMHLAQGHTLFLELGAQLQMDGSSQWHKRFNYPSVSFLFKYMDFGFDEVLGLGVGAQAVTYLPYFRRNGWSFGSRLGAGLGVVTKKFDQQSNPKNNAIGSTVNALVTFGFKGERQFKRSSLGVEVNMTHLSNGAFRLPNLGLNLPKLGVHYTHFLEDLNYVTPEETTIEELVDRWSLHTQLILSTKQIYPTGGSNYGIVSLTNFVQFMNGPAARWELGLDAIYNQSIIRTSSAEEPSSKNFQLGSYFAYVMPYNRVDFLIGMGRYLYNPLNPNGMWYHKLGARVALSDRLRANIVIKAHWAKADYFEYGLTYRW